MIKIQRSSYFGAFLLLAALGSALLAAQETVVPPEPPQPVPPVLKKTTEPPVIKTPPPPGVTPIVDVPPAPAAERPRLSPPPPPASDTRPSVQRPVATPSSPPEPSPAPVPAEPPQEASLRPAAPAVVKREPAVSPTERIPSPPAPLGSIEAPAPPDRYDNKVEANSTASTADADEGSKISWLMVAALLLPAGAAAVFLARRRRERGDRKYSRQPVAGTPSAPEYVTAQSIAVPASVAASATAKGATRPRLELSLLPIRAGVDDHEVLVEFVLRIENSGTSTTEEVWVSSFMRPASVLEEPHREKEVDQEMREARLPVSIEPGKATRIQSTVRLPRETLQGVILPTVIANARYVFSDGTRGQTSAAFAVGLPKDGELLAFDVDHPSGLHDNIEARPQRGDEPHD